MAHLIIMGIPVIFGITGALLLIGQGSILLGAGRVLFVGCILCAALMIAAAYHAAPYR